MPRAPRAYWKGFLRLTSFRSVSRSTTLSKSKSEISDRRDSSGRHVGTRRSCKASARSRCRREGYEVDADTYVLLEPDEIDAIKLESKRTRPGAVRRCQADPIRVFERPYYMAPVDDMAGKATSSSARHCAKPKVASPDHSGPRMAGRGRLEDGLVMEMLRYAEELRDPPTLREASGRETREGNDRPGGAAAIVGYLQPKNLQDHYATALESSFRTSSKGTRSLPRTEDARPQGSNVVDLMEALKRSIGEPAPAKTKAQPRRKKRA